MVLATLVAVCGCAVSVATAGPAAAATTPVVSTGTSHTCALMPSGQVNCWGSDQFGQLGDNSTTTSTVPVGVAGLPPASSVTAGSFHTCAVDHTGAAWCWGSGDFGQLGNGKTVDKDKPVAVSGGLTFSQLSAGGISVAGPNQEGDFTCGVTASSPAGASGQVYCWGLNSEGQLGNGTTTSSDVPVAVTGLPTAAVQVAAGALHACAVLTNGKVFCWGENNDGQLGNGTTTRSLVPVKVTGLSTATAVGAGTYHSCALLSGGAISCWGDNQTGALGDGNTTNSSSPQSVGSLASPAQQIAVGGYHTCALVAGSVTEVECWGDPLSGELGDGHFTEPAATSPEPVFGVGGSPAGTGVIPTQVAAGQQHTCAVATTGQVYCWGSNTKGQVGDGTKADRAVPALVLGLTSGPQQISEGASEGCALNAGLGVQCWGSFDGNDFNAHTSAQGVAALPSGMAQVAAGEVDACATTIHGLLDCWGLNDNGQDGNGTTSPQPTPVAATGLSSGVGPLAVGDSEVCAEQSHLFCAGGGGEGELGDGSTSDSDVPQPVSVVASQVSAGFGHACAVLKNNSARCWGANDYGELGDGTTNNSDLPVAVVGLPAAPVQIAAGGTFDGSSTINAYTCALLVTGVVKCWGNNVLGQLGDGSTNNSTKPVKVGLSGPAKAITAGAYSACALLMTGTVQCWGDDGLGELGNGGSGFSDTPVNVSGLSGVIQISSNDGLSACALLGSGASPVRCWGDNSADELGDGVSGGFSNTPQTVSGL
jgi:alpha-tubulin suppressor-like RCC1 family protein